MLLRGGDAEVFQVEHDSKETLDLATGRLDLEVLVTDDDQAGDCALLLAHLDHLQGHLDLAYLSLAIVMYQLHIYRIFTQNGP